MIKMTDTLCKWKKDIQEKLFEVIEKIKSPVFLCKKCARIAAIDKLLCKSVEISKYEKSDFY